MTEEKDYEVVLTVKVTTTITFGPIERDRPITKRDAIDNAIGSFRWEAFEDEGFAVSYPIDGEAREL